jgi:hypothetical protein
MRKIQRSTLMAGLIVFGCAGVARSEPAPPALARVAWQVLPNTCWARQRATTTTRVDERYERTTVRDYPPCDYPIRHVTDRALVDVPTRDGQVMHRVRIDGDFRGRRHNERVVIVADGGQYWDPRFDAMAMRGFVVDFLDVMRWQDHRIYAETPRRLQPGRYAVALVYDVTSNPNVPEFMLGSVVTWFTIN